MLSWLASFLKGRGQEVWISPFSSESCELRMGVLQGSALSPSLFNLYLPPLALLSEAKEQK